VDLHVARSKHFKTRLGIVVKRAIKRPIQVGQATVPIFVSSRFSAERLAGMVNLVEVKPGWCADLSDVGLAGQLRYLNGLQGTSEGTAANATVICDNIDDEAGTATIRVVTKRRASIPKFTEILVDSGIITRASRGSDSESSCSSGSEHRSDDELMATDLSTQPAPAGAAASAPGPAQTPISPAAMLPPAPRPASVRAGSDDSRAPTNPGIKAYFTSTSTSSTQRTRSASPLPRRSPEGRQRERDTPRKGSQ
jgi:hypothetical protein